MKNNIKLVRSKVSIAKLSIICFEAYKKIKRMGRRLILAHESFEIYLHIKTLL